jgi:hypothetical protein
MQAGIETLGFDFNLVHAQQYQRSFSNFTLSDIEYTNKNGGFFIENLSLEDNRHRNYNTTILKSDVLDIVVDGNFKNIRPIPFVSELVRSYLPAYTMNEQKALRRIKEDLKQFDFEYAIDIKDANRVFRVLYPGLSISSNTQITSFFRREDNQLNLMISADTIRYQDLAIFDTDMLIVGDADELKMNFSADKISFGSHYQIFNLKDELSLTPNLWNNRLNWSNWEDKTYCGNLETSVSFASGDKNDYIADIRIHPGVIIMDDSIWKVAPAQLTLQGRELKIQDFSIYH